LHLSALQARGLSPLFYTIKVALTHLKTSITLRRDAPQR